MSRNFDGTTGYLSHPDGSDIPVSPYNFTTAIWVNLDVSGRRAPFCGFYYHPSSMPGSIELGDSTVGGGHPPDNKVYGGFYNNGVGWFLASDPSDFPLSVWKHVAVTFDGANVRTYVAGAQVAAASVTSTPLNDAGTDYIVFGRNAVFTDGRGAEVAYWKAALSAGEINALAKGATPWMVRPADLRLYVPIWGVASPEIDLMGLHPLTVNGTATVYDHAPVGPPIPGAF